MFPILPSTGMQVEASRYEAAHDNEEEYARRHGYVLQVRRLRAHSPSRARLVLLAAAVVITLALVAALV